MPSLGGLLGHPAIMVIDSDDFDQQVHVFQAVNGLKFLHRRQFGDDHACYRAGRVLRIRPGDSVVAVVVCAGWAEGAALCKKLV